MDEWMKLVKLVKWVKLAEWTAPFRPHPVFPTDEMNERNSLHFLPPGVKRHFPQ